MGQERISRVAVERIALFGCFVALVVTGGASAAWRLTIVAVPLLVFTPPIRFVLAALVVVLVPSLAEAFVHGNWVGASGSRLRLVAGAMVGLSAVALGFRLKLSKPLRQDFAAALPFMAFALALHAVARQLHLIPEQWQYSSGNHESALITFFFVPALALRMPAAARSTALVLLALGLVATGSRWGILTGVVFTLAMGVFIVQGLARRLLVGVTAAALIAPWVFFDLLHLGKAGLIRALAPATMQRPWTGLGPGGSELISLRFVERTMRLTHIESLPLDWAAALGWPMAVLLILLCLVLIFRGQGDAPSQTQQRLQQLAPFGLAALLVHDLLDFSLTSGAVGIAFGLLVGLVLPVRWAGTSSMRWRLVFVGMTLILLGAAVRYDPYHMELSGRLDEISERWGKRPYRYWLNAAQAVKEPAAKVAAYSRAIDAAPGDRRAWFRLGDALWKLGQKKQALLAYRRGLEATRPEWCGVATQRLAKLPLSMILDAIGDHQCAASHVAQTRWADGPKALDLLRKLDLKHAHVDVRRHYLRALNQPGLSRAMVVPELWRLAHSNPRFEGEGGVIVRSIERLEKRVSVAPLFARLVQHNKAHCFALVHWPKGQLRALLPVAMELEQNCRGALLGRGLGLRNLSHLRAIAAP